MSDYFHEFGDRKQWAITIDDGCLLFHPQWDEHPEKTSEHIWREAIEEIEHMGGFDALLVYLRTGVRPEPPTEVPTFKSFFDGRAA